MLFRPHFFPSLSHVHLRALQPIVEAWCKENGVPYRTFGWGEAIWKSWLTFVMPKPIVSDVESLRATPLQSASLEVKVEDEQPVLAPARLADAE